ncbi:MAG TPA: DEAD/DEAH box helicase family protein, partial [Nakamurella sp.]
GGEFTILGVDGGADELPVPGTQRSELRALLGMRDLARDLLAGEAASRDDTPHLDHLRTRLAASYRAYVATYGPINRFTTTISANQLDPESGNPLLTRRTPPVMQILRRDPFGPLVRALESYDDVAGVATPASILAERVVQPRTPILGADTAADALAVTLESRGRVDLADIARLRGLTELEAREELGTLVFQDPANGDLVPAVEYLSGNVRVKLQQAEEAAPSRPDLQVNVAALREVQPADLRPDEIEPRIAAAWISADDHRQFLADLLRDPTARVEHPGGTVWAVRANTWSLQATSEWGTQRRPAGVILHNLLEQRPIEVYDTDPDGKRILNATDTEAAREKAGAMQERFAEWVWEDPDRALRLAGEYNHRFNALVLRDYTTEGENLALPGLARTFTPRPHQRAAAARMISEPAVGLFHQVGAGKTAEMVMGVMELRRLGMASKPVVVVPNHMLEQFSREWLQLYPQARVLAASSDDLKVSKTRDKRREFVARTAANDWDAVVMTREAFERIPVSRDAKAAYMEHEIADQRAMLERAKQADGGLTVKRMEKAVMAAEERLKALLDGPADAGLSFEATGIDYLVIDEAHDYKNLATTSNITGAAIAGAKRSSDLHMKAELLRTTHGHRVITVATATPIANSVTEAHVMQRYLRPDLLRDAGVAD